MKKKLLALIMMVCAIPSFAQMSSGGFSVDEDNLYYGVRIGLTSSTISNTDVLGARTGMTFGGVVGLRVSDVNPLFVESGLYYTQRGGKKNDLSVNLSYLELPVLIKYGFEVADGFAIIPQFGPYFSLGIAGKSKAGDLSVGSFSGDGGYNRFDMGFKLGAGLEYNKLYLELGYQFGVADITDDGRTNHGNAFFANFGVNF